MRLLIWFLRAFIFLVLFAFALNNQQETTLNWFFGYQWQTRTAFVVLAAFALGCIVGVCAMLPIWWRQRWHAPRQAVAQQKSSLAP